MGHLGLWLRWSWRDLRAHWVKVVAIAVVIAIGTGAYAGLSSSANWRRLSNEASFGMLNMHDLRVKLATGSLAAEGSLAATAAGIDHAAWFEAVEERLIAPTQVDASTEGTTVLVPGSLVGVDLATGPAVDGFSIEEGRPLEPGDAGGPAVLLEYNFARFHELPASGSIIVSGGTTVTYVGQALTPEYFVVAPEGQLFFSEASFAAVFTSLETAQQLAGASGAVNDLVLTLTADADRALVAAELEEAFDAAGIGADVLTRDDDTAYGLLTRDVDNDQRFFNVFAVLIFAGAVGAAFNLITRLAEQQRREIGIAMSLGVRPRRIAVRPLLVGAQIALLGILFGIGIGTLIGAAMRAVFVEFLPLPQWRTPFQGAVFARAAAIGFLIPFLATIIPTWRAVRVTPRRALAPAHRSGRGGWLSHSIRRFDLPGNTFAEIPVRNLTRNPRRTLLTVLGIAASITVLVTLLGMVDSFVESVDRAEAETLGDVPERMVVDLDGFYPADSAQVRGIADAGTVAAVEPVLRLGGTVRGDDDTLDVSIQLIDLDGGLWSPTLSEGAVDGRAGLVLTEAAVSDLGVAVGDEVVLRHPVRTDGAALAATETVLPVLATHPYPIRPITYMDISHADVMGLDGMANQVFARPVPEASDGDVRRSLFGLDAVASVQPAAEGIQLVRNSLGEILGVLQVIAGFTLVLALLIAFNSASIALDARSRDHATMFAFGVRIRTALRMAVVESLVVGVIATVVGVAGGLAVVWWALNNLLADTMPDFTAGLFLRPETLAVAAVLGVVVVALAPLFTVRRMRRMDLPGTLRLME
jgi:putative ABC transport system permease protein